VDITEGGEKVIEIGSSNLVYSSCRSEAWAKMCVNLERNSVLPMGNEGEGEFQARLRGSLER